MTKPQINIIKEPTRVWDLEVPSVVDRDKNTVKSYLTGKIEEPCEYNELCYLLDTAEEGTSFDLYINTPGGIIDSAFMIASSISSCKATVTAHLSGTVASAGTLISMACDSIIPASHLSFMIHNYSGGMSGKGHEMKARQRFTDDHLNGAFKDFYSGFLTEEEMVSVIEGTDLWMGTKEVIKRWEGRVNYLKDKV